MSIAPQHAFTFWSRLQLDTSDPTFKRAHQVQVRDPLWFLARQWQVGELTGVDGGSPTNAVYQLQQSALTAYQPAQVTTSNPPVEAIGANDPPLEVRVEREPFPLGLRGSVQLGLRLRRSCATHSPLRGRRRRSMTQSANTAQHARSPQSRPPRKFRTRNRRLSGRSWRGVSPTDGCSTRRRPALSRQTFCPH